MSLVQGEYDNQGDECKKELLQFFSSIPKELILLMMEYVKAKYHRFRLEMLIPPTNQVWASCMPWNKDLPDSLTFQIRAPPSPLYDSKNNAIWDCWLRIPDNNKVINVYSGSTLEGFVSILKQPRHLLVHYYFSETNDVSKSVFKSSIAVDDSILVQSQIWIKICGGGSIHVLDHYKVTHAPTKSSKRTRKERLRQAIVKGDSLIRMSARLQAHDWAIEHRGPPCSYCQKQDTPLVCRHCEFAHYCSTKCQKNHWSAEKNAHQYQCRYFREWKKRKLSLAELYNQIRKTSHLLEGCAQQNKTQSHHIVYANYKEDKNPIQLLHVKHLSNVNLFFDTTLECKTVLERLGTLTAIPPIFHPAFSCLVRFHSVLLVVYLAPTHRWIDLVHVKFLNAK